MAFPQGIDFRDTVGFATDPTNCDCVHAQVYPITTAQGNTVGWEQTPGSVDRAAYTGDSAKLAGFNYSGGTVCNFRIDLPATGSYSVRCAVGDAGSSSFNGYCELFDTTSSLGVLVSQHTAIPIDKFYDATDTLRTSHTDWVSNNALAGPFTFTTTICRFRTSAVGVSLMTHVWVEASGGGGGSTTYTYTPSGGMVFGGAGVVSKDKVFQPAGGLVFGGAGVVSKGKAFQPSGGLVFGGAAVMVKGKVYNVSGGLNFGGGGPGTYTWSGAVVQVGTRTINAIENVGTLLNRS